MSLNIEELQKDVQKKLSETSERNKEAKKTLLKLDIADLKRLAKKQLMKISAKKKATQDIIKKHDQFETKLE